MLFAFLYLNVHTGEVLCQTIAFICVYIQSYTTTDFILHAVGFFFLFFNGKSRKWQRKLCRKVCDNSKREIIKERI